MTLKEKKQDANEGARNGETVTKRTTTNKNRKKTAKRRRRRSDSSDDESNSSSSSSPLSEDGVPSATKETSAKKTHMTRREIVAFNNKQFREFYAKLRVEVIKELYEYLYDSIYYDVFKEIRQRIDDDMTGKPRPAGLKGRTVKALNSDIQYNGGGGGGGGVDTKEINKNAFYSNAIDEDRGDIVISDASRLNEVNLNANNDTICTNDALRSSALTIAPLVMKDTLCESQSSPLEPLHATAFWTEDELAELADRLSIESRLRKADAKFRSHLENSFIPAFRANRYTQNAINEEKTRGDNVNANSAIQDQLTGQHRTRRENMDEMTKTDDAIKNSKRGQQRKLTTTSMKLRKQILPTSMGCSVSCFPCFRRARNRLRGVSVEEEEEKRKKRRDERGRMSSRSQSANSKFGVSGRKSAARSASKAQQFKKSSMREKPEFSVNPYQ